MDICTLWCSGKVLAFSARLKSGVGKFSFDLSLLKFFSVGGVWVWLFPALQLKRLLFVMLHCKIGNGVRAYNMRHYELLSRQFFSLKVIMCLFLKKQKLIMHDCSYSWLTNVDELKDLWCSSTVQLLSTKIWMEKRICGALVQGSICGALVQFGYYQHRHEL